MAPDSIRHKAAYTAAGLRWSADALLQVGDPAAALAAARDALAGIRPGP